MLEFTNIYDLDVNYGAIHVAKKMNEPKVTCTVDDEISVYQKENLERAVFHVIDGHPTVICFIKSNVELYRYIDDIWIIEFQDENYCYLWHNWYYIYLYDKKRKRFIQYGSKKNLQYHNVLYVNMQFGTMSLSGDKARDGLYQSNIGKLVTHDKILAIEFAGTGISDVTEIYNVEQFGCLGVQNICGCDNSNCNLYEHKTWSFISPRTEEYNENLKTPHIYSRHNQLYTTIENKHYLLPIVLKSCNPTSWCHGNHLFIRDGNIRCFGLYSFDEIKNLVSPLKDFTCFLLWCLKQKTTFSIYSFKYYIPSRVFVEYSLVPILQKLLLKI